MIFLSRYLPYTANRWANVGAAAVSALLIVGGGSLEPHYLFIATAEILTLSAITWTALKWENPERKHDIGFNFNPQKSAFGLNYAYRF